MFLQIFQDLKQRYPEEFSRYLSLIAIACFLIDKGCDWLATNKENRTAAVELHYLLEPIGVADIFKTECDDHHLSYVKNRAPGTPKYLLIGKTLHGPDSNGRMSSIALEGKHQL